MDNTHNRERERCGEMPTASEGRNAHATSHHNPGTAALHTSNTFSSTSSHHSLTGCLAAAAAAAAVALRHSPVALSNCGLQLYRVEVRVQAPDADRQHTRSVLRRYSDFRRLYAAVPPPPPPMPHAPCPIPFLLLIVTTRGCCRTLEQEAYLRPESPVCFFAGRGSSRRGCRGG